MSETLAKTRAIEVEVTIEATVDAVWKALSESAGLKRWFASDASVEPGPGGRVWLSWGPGMEGTGLIEAWEPGRRLSWVESGWGDVAAPVRLVVDFELAGRGEGSTVVRLVHSGFSADANWDEQYDATEAGWTWFLFHLAFSMERHGGQDRRMVWVRRGSTRPVVEVWRELLGEQGLGAGEGLVAGQPLCVQLGDGAAHGGRVTMARAPRNLGGVLESLNDALMFVEMEPGAPLWHCGVWISLYGIEERRADALQRSLTGLADRVFGPVSAV